MRRSAFCVAALVLCSTSAAAETIGFSPSPEKAGWRAIAMPGLRPARFSLGPEGALEIVAENAVGWLWRPVSGQASSAGRARWSWLVIDGVGATDLSQRGSDDRALAVYFVFSKEKGATKNPLAQLTGGSAHALVYVFGGKQARGSFITSPHLQSRGKFIVLRPADTQRNQWFSERVKLAEDYARVFGPEMPPLIAVAVSSDSDDTRGRNLVRLRELSITP